MIELDVRIQVKEFPAAELVTKEAHDGMGNIVGMKSQEDYLREIDEMKGRIFFGFVATIETSSGKKSIRIRSEPSSPLTEFAGCEDTAAATRTERHKMFVDGFQAISDSIFRNFTT